MSVSLLPVLFPDGAIRFGTYQNTTDVVCLRRTRARPEEALDISLFTRPDACRCERPVVVIVEVLAIYGGDFYWKAKACGLCKTLVSGFIPFGHAGGFGSMDAEPDIEPGSYRDGVPDWWERGRKQFGLD